jgi:hypothetical protein
MLSQQQRARKKPKKDFISWNFTGMVKKFSATYFQLLNGNEMSENSMKSPDSSAALKVSAKITPPKSRAAAVAVILENDEDQNHETHEVRSATGVQIQRGRQVSSDENEFHSAIVASQGPLPPGKKIQFIVDKKSYQLQKELSKKIRETTENAMPVREDTKVLPTCIVCFDKPPDSILMRCGHGGISRVIYAEL